jgi:hypothetical protein
MSVLHILMISVRVRHCISLRKLSLMVPQLSCAGITKASMLRCLDELQIIVCLGVVFSSRCHPLF